MSKKQPPAKRPPKRRGRKPEITEAQMVQLEGFLANHLGIKGSCILVGIPVGTYHGWCARADEPDSAPIYKEFRDRMLRARQMGKAQAVKQITDAGKQDWRAIAWLLERTHPDEFGPKDRLDVKHTGTVQHEHKAIVVNIPSQIATPRITTPQIDARKDPKPTDQ